MEKKYRRIDHENEPKFLILQIGRKYTYAGFSDLHKPVVILKTPEIFVFNKNFHYFIENEIEIQKICKLVMKKIKIKPSIEMEDRAESREDGEIGDKNEVQEKEKEAKGKGDGEGEGEGEGDAEGEAELNEKENNEENNEGKTKDTELNEKEKNENNHEDEKKKKHTDEIQIKEETIEHKLEGAKIKKLGDENEKREDKFEEKTTKIISSEESIIKHDNAPFIYHYEYKYNQNSNLWSCFFEEYLLRIFHSLIRINTKTKRVVLILNMFFPTIIKYTLCKSLLQNNEVASISYINDLVSPLYISNCNTCVVVDLGYIHCRLLPVLNGFPLYHHYTYIDNGGVYINNEIRKLLKLQYLKRRKSVPNNVKKETLYVSKTIEKTEDIYDDAGENTNGTNVTTLNDEHDVEAINSYYHLYSQEKIEKVIDEMTDDDIEIIKIRYFYLKNEKNNFYSDKYILFEIKDYKIIIDPETRWKACEILFTKKYDHNMYSLFSNFIEKLDHLNYTVFYNIILCGGCSNIKGILSRIAEVIFETLKKKNKFIVNFENNVKFVFPKVAPNLRQFVGASVYANLENLPEYTIEHINNNVLYKNLSEDVYLNFKR